MGKFREDSLNQESNFWKDFVFLWGRYDREKKKYDDFEMRFVRFVNQYMKEIKVIEEISFLFVKFLKYSKN